MSLSIFSPELPCGLIHLFVWFAILSAGINMNLQRFLSDYIKMQHFELYCICRFLYVQMFMCTKWIENVCFLFHACLLVDHLFAHVPAVRSHNANESFSNCLIKLSPGGVSRYYLTNTKPLTIFSINESANTYAKFAPVLLREASFSE